VLIIPSAWSSQLVGDLYIHQRHQQRHATPVAIMKRSRKKGSHISQIKAAANNSIFILQSQQENMVIIFSE
jgi:hypothetical protein